MNAENYTLRPARSTDASAIVEVHRAAIRGTAVDYYDSAIIDEWAPLDPPAERVESLAARIKSGEEVIIVAENSSAQIVGFGSIGPKDSELRAVYVDPSAGRQGIGQRLLERVEAVAKEIGLSALKMDASINAEAFISKTAMLHQGGVSIS